MSYGESATKSAIESNIIKEDTRINAFEAPVDDYKQKNDEMNQELDEQDFEALQGIPTDVFTKVPTNWEEYIDKQIGL